MSVPNPITHDSPTTLPSTIILIAGIKVHIHGLTLLPPSPTSIHIIWLLHPRGQTSATMAPIAASLIQSWYDKHSRNGGVGVIAAAFDARNHGDRMGDDAKNGSWREGNTTHALDMFGVYEQTAADVVSLASYLPAYLLPLIKSHPTIGQQILLGVSLGGHASYPALLFSKTFSAAVVVIGCPDFGALMAHRAAKSKLSSWTTTRGKGFFGGPDFPDALVGRVRERDPAAWVLGSDPGRGTGVYSAEVTGEQAERLGRALEGKKVLCLSGGKDKLVPYECSKPFLEWVKRAVGKGGKCADQGIEITDIVDPEAGHVFSPMMRKEALKFVCEILPGEEGHHRGESKI